MKKLALGHGRKIGVMVLNFLFGNFVFYRLVGFLNRYTKKVKNIFMLYPANEKYSRDYVYPFYERQMKWKPRLVGILWQNKKIGFIFGVSATEKDFFNKDNDTKLREVEEKLEQVRRAMNAEQKTFAGILPGLFFSRGIIEESPEREVTVSAVTLAIRKIQELEKIVIPKICILGGNGFIGSDLRQKIGESFSFDIEDEIAFQEFAKENREEQVILINLTKKGVLKKYIPYLWEKVVVLNEVYPEPSKEEIEKMKKKRISCYHIVGARGGAWPAFPRGYAGGIPCCASFWPDKGEYEVVVKKL